MKSRFIILLIIVLFIQCNALNTVNSINEICHGTEFPIVGVVTQEISSLSFSKQLPDKYKSYIAASYIKAVESSGARVVPIFTNRNESYYKKILESVNGIVLPGGSSAHGAGHPYYDTVKVVYHLAKQINDKNITFPIFAICLAFEFLFEITENDALVVNKCYVYYESLSIDFSGNFDEIKKTSMYSDLTSEQYDILKNNNVTSHWHTWCLWEDTFVNSTALNTEFTLTSTTKSSLGNRRFVNSVEHKKYPFFGTQFHPEKVAFEWSGNHWNHTKNTVFVNRYFYDFLTKLARKNCNKFANNTEEFESLIYNYDILDTRNYNSSSFEQIYAFEE